MAAIKEVATVSDTDKIAAKDEQVTRLKVLLREWREVWKWKVADEELSAPSGKDDLAERTDKELES
jgi:hypothetical protein